MNMNKKLLSLLTAGILALESVVFFTPVATAAGTEVLRFTPVIDGAMDAAYSSSLCIQLDTVSDVRHTEYGPFTGDNAHWIDDYDGNIAGDLYLLYDSGYIYIYADITDSTVSPLTGSFDPKYNNNLTLSFYNGSDWWGTSDELTFNAANGYAYVSQKNGTTGSNFSSAYETATPSSEYRASVKTDRSGYTVEARIAASSLSAGKTWQIGLGANDVTPLANFWRFGYIYSTDVFNNWSETVTLGSAYSPEDHIHVWSDSYTVDVPPTCTVPGTESRHCLYTDCGISTDSREVAPLGHSYEGGICSRCGARQPLEVLYGTPELDGIKDELYLSSASVNTVSFAQTGDITVGMASLSRSKLSAYAAAGIISDTSSTVLLPGGDYSIPEFPKGEISFLWDNDAVYVFSKIYDSDILVPDPDVISHISSNTPWLTDSVTNIIYPDGNPYAEIKAYGLAGGAACWDPATPGGWSVLGNFINSSAAKRASDAENVASVVRTSDGYYTVEMRIPVSGVRFGSGTLKTDFLIPGKSFTYNFYITDGENGFQSNGFHTNNVAIYMSTEGIDLELVGDGKCNWMTEPVIDVPPTCTEAGSSSIHCANCDAVKDVTSIPPLGHSYKNGVCVRCGAIKPGISFGLSAVTTSAAPGTTVSVCFRLDSRVSLKSFLLCDLEYDATVLALKNMHFEISGAEISETDTDAGIMSFAMASDTAFDGRLLTLTFEVLPDAPLGSSSVSAFATAGSKPSGSAETEVQLYLRDAVIEITDNLPGDMNGDGYVDSDDALLLLRHSFRPQSYPISADGDTDGDGNIDSDDSIYLLRHCYDNEKYPLS